MTAKPLRILFYVQHLLGVGHVKRAAAIAKGLSENGMDVVVVLGGMPVKTVDFGGAMCLQLPPCRSLDASFSAIVNERGHVIDDSWKQTRRDKLLGIFDDIKPDVLIIELFPFGRRAFRFELLPLLAHARGQCFIACSVRDVLVEKKDSAKTRQTLDWVDRYFDRVLVHGDADFIAFDETFPAAREIAGKISYTGYVTETTEISAKTGDGSGEVVVSTGGGAVGAELIKTAMDARPYSRLKDRIWRILVGENLSENLFQEFKAGAGSGIIVERARKDFRQLLVNSAVSVSQGGYNTVMDILTSGCRAVIVPFSEGGESEQTYRARKLQNIGVLECVDEAGLDGKTLALAIDRAASGSITERICPDLSGVEKTAEILLDLVSLNR